MLIVVEVNVGAEFLPDGLLDKVCEEILKYLEQSEFLAILIQAMKSIGESRMTDQHRTVINGKMLCQSIL